MKKKNFLKNCALIFSALLLTNCATTNEVKKLIGQSNAALVNIGTTSLGYGPLGQSGMASDKNSRDAGKLREQAEGQLRGAISGFHGQPLLRDPLKFRLGYLYTIAGSGSQAQGALAGLSPENLNRRDQILLQAQPALLALYKRDVKQMAELMTKGLTENPAADEKTPYPSGSHMARLENAIGQAASDNNPDLTFYLTVTMNDLLLDFVGNGTTRKNRSYVGSRLVRASEKSQEYFPAELIGKKMTGEDASRDLLLAYRKHHIVRIGRMLRNRGLINEERGGPAKAATAGWESE